MAATLYAVGIGTTILGGITQQNIVTGSQARGEGTSAEVYARIASLIEQKIAPGFTTQAIAAALAACGIAGCSIPLLSGGLALYAQNRADGGIYSAGATHRKFAFATGVLAPAQLNCAHRGDATLSYQALISSPAGADPLIFTDSTAVPAFGTDQDERFTLGPVTIGGVTLTGIRSVGINFGIVLASEGSDSAVWDSVAFIREIRPIITLSGIDPTWLAAAKVPLAGLAATHANTTIYLRKRAAGGTFVDDETEEHVSIAAAGYAHVDTAFDSSGAESGTVSLQLTTYYDGTNAPLVIDTATALP
jgi:hypothetical protein